MQLVRHMHPIIRSCASARAANACILCICYVDRLPLKIPLDDGTEGFVQFKRCTSVRLMHDSLLWQWGASSLRTRKEANLNFQ